MRHYIENGDYDERVLRASNEANEKAREAYYRELLQRLENALLEGDREAFYHTFTNKGEKNE